MLRKKLVSLWKMGDKLLMKERLLWRLNNISTRTSTLQIQNQLILLPKKMLQRSHIHQFTKKERANQNLCTHQYFQNGSSEGCKADGC
uniref:Uncharacterized protein n=1 Tax=Solanum lycopersicum TaxID=4081 RepID=A0A3Q7EWT2_SOLLC